ncbi:MAG: GlsB/YeaQ/YmgE family stress response membrane protein [Acholeplasma sp.]|nr:GlsB/YeaQ/YmgE family stress response membrane protein [Acholeplasma sp.]
MYILLWLVFGGVVGWVASLLIKENQRMGLIANLLVGVIGSALGMWLLDLFNLGKPDTFSFSGFLVSVLGASLLLVLFRTLRKTL